MSTKVWLLFALFIVYSTTIPFRVAVDPEAVREKLSRLTLNPFVSDTGGRVSISDSVQNVVLFVPFGALGAMALRNRPRSTVGRVVVVTVLGGGLSVTVETLQLFMIDRVTSFSDVTTDTVGTLLGAVLAEQWRPLSTRSLRWLAATGLIDQKAFYPALVAAVVVAVAAWQPFDFVLDRSHIGASLRALWRDPWQFGGFRDEGSAFVQYALFAAAICAWFDGVGIRRVVSSAAAVGIALAIVLEVSQFVVASRMPGTVDALVRSAGVLAGTMLWSAGRGRKGAGWWMGLLIIATAVSAATQLLSPFEVAEVRRPFGWLPFIGYYESTWFAAVSHAVELMLLYFPLGFCIGWVLGRPRAAAMIALGVTLLVCAPVEYFQGWIVGRYPDITDVVFSLAGAWLGAWTSTRGARAFEETLASVTTAATST